MGGILLIGGFVFAGVILAVSCEGPGSAPRPSMTPHVYEMEHATCYVMYGNANTQAISCVSR